MQQTVLLTLTASLATLAAAGSVLPRIPPSNNFQITDFSVGSSYPDPTQYSFSVTNDYIGAHCSASTTYSDGSCGEGTATPTSVGNTTCNPEWSWSFTETTSPTEPSQKGFLFEVAYNAPPGGVVTRGCRFIPYYEGCSTSPRNVSHADSHLDAPSAFNVTGQTGPCVLQ